MLFFIKIKEYFFFFKKEINIIFHYFEQKHNFQLYFYNKNDCLVAFL